MKKVPPVDFIANFGETVKAAQERAHHAKNVSEIVIPVAGHVQAFCQPISMRRNIIWVASKATGILYAVAYAHKRGTIEIRERNQKGRALYTFTNTTPNSDLLAAFKAL